MWEIYIQERISPNNSDSVSTNSVFPDFMEYNYQFENGLHFFPRLFNMLQVFAILLLRSVLYIFLTQVSLSHSSPSLWPWFQPGCTSESPGDLSQNLDAQTPSPEVQIQLLQIGPRVSVGLKTPRLSQSNLEQNLCFISLVKKQMVSVHHGATHLAAPCS